MKFQKHSKLKLAFTFIFILNVIKIYSQVDSTYLLKQFHGVKNEYITNIITDEYDNFYISGHFFGPAIQTDWLILENETVNYYDSFFIKYNKHGHIQLAKIIHGDKSDEITGIAVDTLENIFVAGNTYSSTLSVDSFSTEMYGGNVNAFLFKFDSLGSFQWGDFRNTLNSEKNDAITVSTSNFLYLLSSSRQDEINIPITYGDSVFTSSLNNYEIYISKYSSSGNILWTKKLEGYGHDEPYKILVDKYDNIYISGVTYSNKITLDGAIIFETTNSYENVLIIKFDTDGNIIKLNSISGLCPKEIFSFSLDLKGDIFLSFEAGCDSIIVNEESIFIGEDNIYNNGIAKFDKDLNLCWMRPVPYQNAMATSNNIDSIISFGYIYKPTVIAGDTIVNTNEDIVMVQNDNEGIPQNVIQLGGKGDDWINTSFSDNYGNTYFAGKFLGSTFIYNRDTIFNYQSQLGYSESYLIRFGNCTAIKEKISCINNTLIAPEASYYQWFCNGNIIAGANSSTYKPNENANYSVQLKFDNNCQAFLSVDYIQNRKNENSIFIFPNPTNESFTLISTELINEITIYNTFGAIIYTEKVAATNSFSIEIDLPGVYFIRVNANEDLTGKLIVF